MNKLEGFISVDDEKVSCSHPDCKNKPVISTIIKDTIKGLHVDKIHFWCKEHYDNLNNDANVEVGE